MVVALSSFVFKLAGAPVVVQRRSSPSIFPAQPTNSCPTHKTTTHNSLHDLVLSSSLSYPCPDPLDLHTPIPSTASVSRLPRRLARKESLLPSVLAAEPSSRVFTSTRQPNLVRYHSICTAFGAVTQSIWTAKPGFERTRFFFSSNMPGYNHQLDEVTSPSRYCFHSFSSWEAVRQFALCV